MPQRRLPESSIGEGLWTPQLSFDLLDRDNAIWVPFDFEVPEEGPLSAGTHGVQIDLCLPRDWKRDEGLNDAESLYIDLWVKFVSCRVQWNSQLWFDFDGNPEIETVKSITWFAEDAPAYDYVTGRFEELPTGVRRFTLNVTVIAGSGPANVIWDRVFGEHGHDCLLYFAPTAARDQGRSAAGGTP